MANSCPDCLESIESELGLVNIEKSCCVFKRELSVVQIDDDNKEDEMHVCPDCGTQLSLRGNASFCGACGWQPIIY